MSATILGVLIRGMCATAGIDLWSLRPGAGTRILKRYLKECVRIAVRARGNPYDLVLRVKPARACACDGPCDHTAVLFTAAEWSALQDALGRVCVPDARRAAQRDWLFADPFQTHPPSGAEDSVVAPVYIPEKHQQAVVKLVQSEIQGALRARS